jgi:uncharacterized protein involved in exopolysaccharide biosynthesis
MLRFLDCFYRHRRLMLAILAIPFVLGVGFILTHPRDYEATARVWVDESIENGRIQQYVTPAQVGTELTLELVRTRAFCLKTAARSRLGDDLVMRNGHSLTPQARDDLIYKTIGSQLTVIAGGPNVVDISFQYLNPQVAAGTAQAIVDLFREDVLGRQVEQARATVRFYQDQVQTARKDLSVQDARVADYQASHPDAASTGSPADPTSTDPVAAALPGSTSPPADVALVQLQHDDTAAQRRVDDLVTKQDKSQLDLAMAQQATPYGVRAIDRPLVPNVPVPRLKLLLTAGLGALAAGPLLCLLSLIALTAADSSVRYGSEVEPALSLRLAGAVPFIR